MKTDAMTTFESALVVPFPRLEPVVSPHRSALDSGAIRGVPAHVTVLYPFMPPERLSASVLAELGRLLAEIAPFDTTFDAVDWFGDGVVYLRPTPDRPF